MSAAARLKVLHVIPAVAPRYGGPSGAVVGMCRALESAGVSSAIATTDADGPDRLDVPLGAWRAYRDVPMIAFKKSASESFKYSSTLAAWLDAHVADFDIVHVHAVFSHSSIAAGRACRTAGVPYFVRPLGTLDPWSVRQKALRKRVLSYLGVNQLLAGAAAMHYTSAEEGRLAEQAWGQLPEAVTIPVGIDDAHFAPRRSKPEAMVLALSRVDPKKRLDWLITEWHRVTTSSPLSSWTLVIAGEGDREYVESLKRLAEAGPARNRIAFPGWIEGQAKRDLLARAALFVLPSHQENFGIAMVEALAAGVPALVSAGVNLGGELVQAEAGWQADSDAAFSHALVGAMGRADERERRGIQAQSFAERFRWPVVADRLVAAYENILASSRPRRDVARRAV